LPTSRTVQPSKRFEVEASPEELRRFASLERRRDHLRATRRPKNWDDPVAFARDTFGFHAWSKQREILEGLRDHDKVAVRSSHGIGKTATAAQAVLWFLASFPNSRVISTAPTWTQVEQLLWRAIRGQVARAHEHGLGEMFPTPHTTKLEMGPEWFAIGQSTDQPERFQGHHADHLLLVVDEASGVAETIFEAAEGFLTAEGAKVLLIGNPTQLGGQFNRAFTSERERWHQVHVSTFDTPNYTGETVPPDVARALPRAGWAEEMADAWGEDSPVYQVRVLGNFATNAADSIIPLAWVEAAQHRWQDQDHTQLGPLKTIGADIARSGTDRTVLAIRHDLTITELRRLPHQGTMETAGHIKAALSAMSDLPFLAPTAIVDVIGIGAGVVDRLRELEVGVVPFNAAERSDRKDKTAQLGFINKRAAAWWNLREMLDPANETLVALPPDDKLTGDLTTPKWRVQSGGKIQIESKDDIRKRLGRSTDDGDAVVQAYWPEGGVNASLDRFAADPDASFYAEDPTPSRHRIT
jgi:phage terminase large subunit